MTYFGEGLDEILVSPWLKFKRYINEVSLRPWPHFQFHLDIFLDLCLMICKDLIKMIEARSKASCTPDAFSMHFNKDD
jgi:hypothetical protein